MISGGWESSRERNTNARWATKPAILTRMTSLFSAVLLASEKMRSWARISSSRRRWAFKRGRWSNTFCIVVPIAVIPARIDQALTADVDHAARGLPAGALTDGVA